MLELRSLIFTPNLKNLVGAGEAGVIVWWNSATDQRKATVAGQEEDRFIAWLSVPEQQNPWLQCGEETIKIWEAVSAREKAAFKGHTCGTVKTLHSSLMAIE